MNIQLRTELNKQIWIIGYKYLSPTETFGDSLETGDLWLMKNL